MSAAVEEEKLGFLMARYGQKIFAFALHLIGGDKDKAYDVAAACFAETSLSPSAPGRDLLADLAGAVVEKSRSVEAIPCLDDRDFERLVPQERNVLRLVRAALQSLDFEDKALILLRDQLNLAYAEVAGIFGFSERDARDRTIRARADLRKQVESRLRHAG